MGANAVALVAFFSACRSGIAGASMGFLSPSVMEMSQGTATEIFDDNLLRRKPILVLFRDREANQASITAEDAVRAAAPEVRKKVMVVVSGLQTDLEVKLMNTMKIYQLEEPPILAILSFDFAHSFEHADFHTFRFKGEAINQSAVVSFVSNYMEGTLKQEEGILSEPLPDPEGEYDGAVRQLVGKNYNAAVEDQMKDTLVYFYADSCGFCNKFKAEYKELAMRLQHVKSLDIAWIDASRNGVPQPRRFPTVVLFPAHGKQAEGVEFLNNMQLNAVEFMGDILRGEQTVHSMMQWLHKEAVIPFEDFPPAATPELADL